MDGRGPDRREGAREGKRIRSQFQNIVKIELSFCMTQDEPVLGELIMKAFISSHDPYFQHLQVARTMFK